MKEILYMFAGVVGSGIVFYLFKILGGKKGTKVESVDSEEVSLALNRASKIVAEKAATGLKYKEELDRLNKKLEIEDPLERITEIAKELKDL